MLQVSKVAFELRWKALGAEHELVAGAQVGHCSSVGRMAEARTRTNAALVIQTAASAVVESGESFVAYSGQVHEVRNGANASD